VTLLFLKEGTNIKDKICCRFAGLFTDKNFEVDTTEEAYRLLNPVVTKLDKECVIHLIDIRYVFNWLFLKKRIPPHNNE
jgi:hypothetical protein